MIYIKKSVSTLGGKATLPCLRLVAGSLPGCGRIARIGRGGECDLRTLVKLGLADRTLSSAVYVSRLADQLAACGLDRNF